MQLNKLRKRIGFWMSETAQSIMLSLGAFVLIVLALNGFSFDASIYFLDNFTSRYLAANEITASHFSGWVKAIAIGGAGLILIIRIIDRRSKKETGS